MAAARLLASGDVDAMTGPLPERAFTHADGNLGNILWDGERCCVVDSEDSGLSDPAYEVADLVEHVSVWPGNPGHHRNPVGSLDRQARRLLDLL